MAKAHSRFIRASELVGLPVVTLSGDSGHEAADLYLAEDDRRSVVALGVREPGLLGGRNRSSLPVDSVVALGSHAVMIEADAVFEQPGNHLGITDIFDGLRVITDDGTSLGAVTDAVVQTSQGRVELAAVELDRPDGGGVAYLELPQDMVLSDEALVVDAAHGERLCSTPDELADAMTRTGEKTNDQTTSKKGS